MITSNQILKICESWDKRVLVRGKLVDVYENPDNSDIRKIYRDIDGKLKLTRFIADVKTKKVYVWDGGLAIHRDIFSPLGFTYSAFSTILGEADIVSGKLIFHSSDSTEAFWGMYMYAIEKKGKADKSLTDYFKADWSWVDRYISGVGSYMGKKRDLL